MRDIRIYLGRLQHFRKFLLIFLPHLTVRKAANLLLNEIEMRFRVASPRSLPPYIKVEPTPLCHLRCPSCVHGSPEFRRDLSPSMMLSPEDFKKIIEPIRNTLLGVSLSWLGEPLLHKDLCTLIEFLHARNIAVSFPTNLSLPLEEAKAERLVASGVDYIHVALDGASAESYEQYRVGGNFDLVLANVKLLDSVKKKLRRKRPVLVWKFVVFKHNRHELPLVEERFATLGFDAYELVYDDYSANTNAAVNQFRDRMSRKKKPCYWLWNTAIVRWNGSVLPCCDLAQSFKLGNAIDTDLREVWRSPAYAAVRAGFRKKEYGTQMHPQCRICVGLAEV